MPPTPPPPTPRRTRIKICGVRRVADALLAARAGADAVGIVCYPKAARHVSAEVAREIAQSLPAFVTPVALFVDPGGTELAGAAAAIGVSTIQLHGHESPTFVREAREHDVLKAIRVDRGTFERELDTWRAAAADRSLPHLKGLVLESAGPGVGGTGVANDWDYIADVAARGGFDGLPPIVAAGGLTPDTVGDVVRAIRPWAVDVSSGVERTKGEKDPGLVERFVAAVRAADAEGGG